MMKPEDWLDWFMTGALTFIVSLGLVALTVEVLRVLF